MDYQTFKTRKDALREMFYYPGYGAEPVRLTLPAEDKPQGAPQWVIRCDGDKYLRTDGYVR